MPLAAPAASQAKSFQLQPLPFGRLSYSSFPAPGLNENRMPTDLLCLPELRKRQRVLLYPIRSIDLQPYWAHPLHNSKAGSTLRIMDAFMAAGIKEYG